jgi:hypothetical protein
MDMWIRNVHSILFDLVLLPQAIVNLALFIEEC